MQEKISRIKNRLKDIDWVGDFFITYGWAILVIISVIAAMAFFGILDAERLFWWLP